MMRTNIFVSRTRLCSRALTREPSNKLNGIQVIIITTWLLGGNDSSHVDGPHDGTPRYFQSSLNPPLLPSPLSPLWCSCTHLSHASLQVSCNPLPSFHSDKMSDESVSISAVHCSWAKHMPFSLSHIFIAIPAQNPFAI